MKYPKIASPDFGSRQPPAAVHLHRHLQDLVDFGRLLLKSLQLHRVQTTGWRGAWPVNPKSLEVGGAYGPGKDACKTLLQSKMGSHRVFGFMALCLSAEGGSEQTGTKEAAAQALRQFALARAKSESQEDAELTASTQTGPRSASKRRSRARKNRQQGHRRCCLVGGT